MIKAICSFLNWVVYLPIFNPLFDYIGWDMLGTTPKSVRNYAVRGFEVFWADVLPTVIIIVVVIGLAEFFLRKYLKKKNPAKFNKPVPEMTEEEAKKYKTKKTVKKVVQGVVAFILAFVILVLSCALMQAKEFLKSDYPGNGDNYAPETVKMLADSPIKGKNILWVGSSVVEGNMAKRDSMVEFIAALDGANCVKDSISGTTIAYQDESSYVYRMQQHGADEKYDAVVIQLSTNDAGQGSVIGELSDSFNKADFDQNTVIGAMEIMFAHVRENWGDIPVFYFTVPSYNNERLEENYGPLIEATKKVCEKWNADVLDLWYNEEFNNVTAEQWSYWMANASHPMRAGYLEWWTPAFQEQLYSYFE